MFDKRPGNTTGKAFSVLNIKEKTYEEKQNAFLTYVEQELEHLEAFDLSGDYHLLKAAAALVIVREYLIGSK